MVKNGDDYNITAGGTIPWQRDENPPDRPSGHRSITITDVEITRVDGNFDWAIVHIKTDSGITGLGETFPVGNTVEVTKYLGDQLIGHNPLNIAYLRERYAGRGRTERAGFAGIEIALWDIKGKVLNVPVYELLGGLFRKSVPIYCDLHAGMNLGEAQGNDGEEVYSSESFVTAAVDAEKDGFEMLKFDIDILLREDQDTAARRLTNQDIQCRIDILKKIQHRINNTTEIAVDCHWSFTVETAIRLGRKLDDIGIAWLEDPVHPQSPEPHRRVTQAIETPVLSGENLSRADQFEAYCRADAIDIAAPDVQNAGGIGSLHEIANICNRAGIPLAIHNISSPVGTIAAVHVAAAASNVIGLEYHAREVPWWNKLVNRVSSREQILQNGDITVPEGSGLGIELDKDILEKHLLK